MLCFTELELPVARQSLADSGRFRQIFHSGLLRRMRIVTPSSDLGHETRNLSLKMAVEPNAGVNNPGMRGASSIASIASVSRLRYCCPMVKSLVQSTSSGISEQDVLFAKESMPFLQACVQTPGSQISLEINGKNLILPEALKLVLSRSVELIAEQRAVTVLSTEDEIGTQEAANMLNVSRPHLVKLLDSGAIDSRKVGVQRRVSVGDVVAYRDTQKAARRRALIELAEEGQRLNLGE